MDEFIKAFRDFIGRDLVFIISGGAVVGSFLYLHGMTHTTEYSSVTLALLSGVGYFLAYGIQDALCIVGWITTTAVRKPNYFVRCLYERYYRDEKWDDKIAHFTDDDLDTARREITNSPQKTELERLITLQQIGTAGGPCMLVCGILFLCMGHGLFHCYVGILGIVLGFILVSLGWLRCARHAQYLFQYHRNHKSDCA